MLGIIAGGNFTPEAMQSLERKNRDAFGPCTVDDYRCEHRLKLKAKLLGIRQIELANHLRMSASKLSNIFNGWEKVDVRLEASIDNALERIHQARMEVLR